MVMSKFWHEGVAQTYSEQHDATKLASLVVDKGRGGEIRLLSFVACGN